MADYQFWVHSPSGTRLGIIAPGAIVSASYSLVTNGVGVLTMELLRDAVDPSWLIADAYIEIRRRPLGGVWTLEGSTIWFIEKIVRGMTETRRYIKVTARSGNTLLARRHAMYYADHFGSIADNIEADDGLKQIADRNIGISADNAATITLAISPTRIITGVLIEGDSSLAPAVTKEFAWRPILAVLQDIANDTTSAGTPLYFGLVWDGDGFLFRTWIGQPGVDRSVPTQLMTISPEFGTLGGTVEMTEDWSNAATLVVAGGQGQNSARRLGSAYDAELIARSPYGLREAFVNATSLSDQSALDAEATAELYRRRPKKVLTGQVVSVAGAEYGRDWGWGDRLKAQFEGEAFTAVVEVVTVKIDSGRDSVEAKIVGAAL